jgi:hypothetical protein
MAHNWPNGSIPPGAMCFFHDGNMIACVRGDFINLQESPVGFGKSRDEAEAALDREEAKIRPIEE